MAFFLREEDTCRTKRQHTYGLVKKLIIDIVLLMRFNNRGDFKHFYVLIKISKSVLYIIIIIYMRWYIACAIYRQLLFNFFVFEFVGVISGEKQLQFSFFMTAFGVIVGKIYIIYNIFFLKHWTEEKLDGFALCLPVYTKLYYKPIIKRSDSAESFAVCPWNSAYYSM